ncbi:MAG: peptidase M14 [Proteobacteria bacterium]|nr:MAG: peptidase M14 [Pseudomonadota bacterium]
MLKLTELDQLPAGFFELDSPKALYTLMPEPTLVHLHGRREARLFVSVLLHGNEDTSFYAIQQLLYKYQHQSLPRSLSIFFGNIEAARYGLRRLDDQPDYNRVWPGCDTYQDTAEARLMQTVTEIMKNQMLFASIDVHNNTGKNPHYGCINAMDNRYLQLARLFSPIVVYFETPRGVQSMAMAKYCPAITIECGKPGQAHGHSVDHVVEFLEAALHLQALPDHPLPPQDINVYRTMAQVTLPEAYSFGFKQTADIHLLPALDRYNFSELAAGTVFAETTIPDAQLIARDDHNQDVTKDYFVKVNGQIALRHGMMPAMLTLDERVIRQDCLCYLMQRIPVDSQAGSGSFAPACPQT